MCVCALALCMCVCRVRGENVRSAVSARRARTQRMEIYDNPFGRWAHSGLLAPPRPERFNNRPSLCVSRRVEWECGKRVRNEAQNGGAVGDAPDRFLCSNTERRWRCGVRSHSHVPAYIQNIYIQEHTNTYTNVFIYFIDFQHSTFDIRGLTYSSWSMLYPVNIYKSLI